MTTKRESKFSVRMRAQAANFDDAWKAPVEALRKELRAFDKLERERARFTRAQQRWEKAQAEC